MNTSGIILGHMSEGWGSVFKFHSVALVAFHFFRMGGGGQLIFSCDEQLKK